MSTGATPIDNGIRYQAPKAKGAPCARPLGNHAHNYKGYQMDTLDRIIYSSSLALLASTITGYVWTIVTLAH